MDIAFQTRKLERAFNSVTALQKNLWGTDDQGHHDANGGPQGGS